MTAKEMKSVLDITHRLSRCEGHLRSIRGMIQDGKSCETLFVQLAAVRSALHEASMKIYDKHIDHCLKNGGEAAHKNELNELKFISRLMLRGKV